MKLFALTARMFAPACFALASLTTSAVATPHASLDLPHGNLPGTASLPMSAIASVPSLEFLAGSWVQVASPRTGIGVWVDTADWSNVVIGFGKDRAKELDNYQTNGRGLANLFDAAGVFSDYRMAFNHLYLPPIPYWYVRNGQSVGLWLHVHAGSSPWTLTSFSILSIVQRPVGATTPPSTWL